MSDVPSYLQPNEAVGLPSAQAPQATPGPVLDVSAGAPSSQVFDPQTNRVLNIPHDDLEVAIRSGKYQALPDVNYGVKDKHGVVADVSGKDLSAALQGNATIAPADEIEHYRKMQKYGDSELAAGIEGFNRGALPGIADRLTAGGKDFAGNDITKSDMIGRAEANPVASTIGELAGTVVSPFTKLVGLGAAATEAGTAKVLTRIGAKAGLTNKVAQAIVSKVVPAAAGSAVEGAYFGAAHLLNEDALGTAQFNAENVMASVEQGALWGAAFGGGLSAAGLAAKGAASAVADSGVGKYVGGKFSDASNAMSSTEQAAREFLGITPSKAAKMAKRDPGFMDDTIKWTQEVLQENPKASLSDVAAKATTDIDEVGKKIGGIYKQIDETGAQNGVSYAGSIKDVKNRIADEIEAKILPKLKGVEGVEGDVAKVRNLIDGIAESAKNAEGNYTAESLHESMVNVQNQIRYDRSANVGGATLKQDMLKVQREVLRDELNKATAAAESANPELKGLLQDLKSNNRRYRTLTSLEDGLALHADKMSMAPGLGLKDLVTGAAFGAVKSPLAIPAVVAKKFLESDMLRKMQILGKIEKFQQQTASAVASGFKSIGNQAAKVEPLATKALVDSHLATELVDGKKRKAADEQQAYRNIAANAKFASDNPEQFLQGVNKYSSHLYGVAPKTSGALDTAALNAMVYLHSKAPQSTKAKGFFDAAKPERVSGQELLKMQQRVDMIQNPTKAIKLLGKGKLGATHIETIKAVYPQMYSEMQKQAMNFLNSKNAANLTYSQKLNMANLLDVQADESMHFSNVLGLQSNFGSGSESGAGGSSGAVRTSQTGLSKLNKAKRTNLDDDEEDT